jgi:hypothetical protein
MPLYKIESYEAIRVFESEIPKEKMIQRLFEKNSLDILDLRVISTEYRLTNSLRIDTIGIDRKKHPCIVEYKKTYSPSVLTQGLSYLSWLFDHKETFEKEAKSLDETLTVNWNNIRLIFVCAYFSSYDIDTVKILPYSVELIKYTYFENGTIYLEKFIEERKRFLK